MDSLLKNLKDSDFIATAEDPYKFFAMLYHCALLHESALIELDRQAGFTDLFENRFRFLSFENGDGCFCVNEILHNFIPEIFSGKQAGLFLIALLRKTDNYLAGLDSAQTENMGFNIISVDVVDRLQNSEYYKPIKIEIDELKAEYIIAPRIEPLFESMIPGEMHSEAYYTSTLSTCFLYHHTVIKNSNVNNHKVIVTSGIKDNPGLIDTFHRPLEAISQLIIGLAPIDGEFIPNPVIGKEMNDDSVCFRYSCIAEPSRQGIRKKIESVLMDAIKYRVDILIFPELSIDHDTFTDLCDMLCMQNRPDNIKLIVAGSFHKERPQGGYVNQSVMLNWKGDIIWTHCKQNPFKLTEHAIEKSSNCDEIRKVFGIQAGQSLVEDVHTDFPITFFDTPIGRMATLICLDFIHNKTIEILSRISCDYFFVPAMTPKIDDFITEAQNVYSKKFHILSACCNSKSCCRMIANKHDEGSFFIAPWLKGVCKGNIELSEKKSDLFIFGCQS